MQRRIRDGISSTLCGNASHQPLDSFATGRFLCRCKGARVCGQYDRGNGGEQNALTQALMSAQQVDQGATVSEGPGKAWTAQQQMLPESLPLKGPHRCWPL